MAASYVTYPGNGSQIDYSITFPYLDKQDVMVTVNDTPVPFTFLNDATVRLTVAPTGGTAVRVRRITQKTSGEVNFTDGSTLLERDLDLSTLRSTYVGEEATDTVNLALNVNSQGIFAARGLRLTNLAPGVDPTDAVNKSQLDVVLPLALSYRDAAGVSATNAAISEGNAFAYLRAYRSTSYGALSGDPLVDPNGDPPTVGDEYFSTVDNLLKRFNGFTWQASDINTGNLAAPGGSSLIGNLQAGVGAVPRTTKAKLIERVSAEDFGATADGVTNNQPAVQKAIDYLYGIGGGVLEFGRGTYGFSAAIKLRPGVTLSGQGNVTNLRVLVDNIELVTRHSDPAGGFVAICNMMVSGYADRNPSLGTTAKLINVGLVDAFFATNVEARYSRTMAITAVATVAVVENCRVYKNHRDGINLTGSNYMRVVNNDIRECGDDSIAVHISSATLGTFDSSVVVTGNVIRKSYGIKVLGARNTTVSNNDLRFWYGYGINIGIDSTSGEGSGAKYAVSITGNSIVDGMNSTVVGAGAQLAGVFLSGARSLGTAGTAIPTLPGNYDAASASFIKPGLYENTNGPAQPRSENSAITVAGNTFKQTIEGITKFSDAGFGSLWNNTGVIDPAMTTLVRGTFGVQLGSSFDVSGLSITGNTFVGVARAFYSTGTVAVLSGFAFVGNTVRRASEGVAINGASSGGIRASGVISGNVFDVDPYCEHSMRTVPIDGSWTATDGFDGFGVDLVSVTGMTVMGNTFLNCVRAVKLSSAPNVVRGNTVFCDWSGGASLKGMASLSGVPVSTNNIVFADCNPTSATFMQVSAAADSGNLVEAAAMPTSGWFRIGHVVTNSAPTIATLKVLAGWRRLTNGNSHVLNTDWAAIYEPTA